LTKERAFDILGLFPLGFPNKKIITINSAIGEILKRLKRRPC